MKFLDLSDGRFFLVKCSDWSVITEASSEAEACTSALTEMLDKSGKDLKLSSVMVTQELIPDVMDERYDDPVSYHSVSRMLANAGMHDLSSSMKHIFGA